VNASSVKKVANASAETNAQNALAIILWMNLENVQFAKKDLLKIN
jgi:hypothetical protein